MAMNGDIEQAKKLIIEQREKAFSKHKHEGELKTYRTFYENLAAHFEPEN